MPLEIVLRAQAGDAGAFEEIVRASIRDLHGLAMVMTGRPGSADDAVQEAFLAAWKGLPRLRDPERLVAWLRRLTVNAALDEHRRTRRRRQVAPYEMPSPGTDQIARMERADEITSAFRRLEPNHRTVLALTYYQDLSERQVAEALGIPVGTVKSRLHHGLRALRSALDAEGRDRGHVVTRGGPSSGG